MKLKMLIALAGMALAISSTDFAASDSDMDGLDDVGNSTSGMQNLAMDNTNANSVMQNPGSGDTTSGANMASAGTGTSSVDSNANVSNSNDDMSADTATGDDDY